MPQSPPLEELPSEELFAIVHSDCEPEECRAAAWDVFRSRPDFAEIMAVKLTNIPDDPRSLTGDR
jgi:hypothetical protein